MDSNNEVIIWIYRQDRADSYLKRNLVFLNMTGANLIDGWRASVYDEDFRKGGNRPISKSSKYEKLNLYHIRRKKMLDKKMTLNEQNLKHGDILMLTDMKEEFCTGLCGNLNIPETLNPKKNSLEKYKLDDIYQPAPPANPWMIGSFYLTCAVISIVLLLVVAKTIGIIYLPIVVIGALLVITIVGALTLRNLGLLPSGDFMEIIKIVFKFLPSFMGWRSKKE